ncbi:MAG: SRPBCC family protein [Acidimicrobiales bacterium]
MELTNEFTVGIPPEQAWDVLTDVERIAPCLPGARLTEVVGDEFHGVVKVKVGPISTEYRGVATFVEQDAGARRAVLRAEGREARGQGTARATVTATLAPAGEATTVRVVTDLAVSGRVAQFGRGVLADVSSRLLAQFAEALEATVSAGGADDGDRPPPAGTADPAPPAGTGPDGGASVEADGATPPDRRSAPPPPPAPEASVDLLATVGPALAKRLLPLLAGVGVLWVAWRRRRR